MTLHLACDRRHREGGEFSAAGRVIAFNCVQQTDGTGLNEVVVLRATAIVAVSESLDEREVELHEAIAGPRVAVCAIGA
jgi:hypothetical protein